ncbi:MAG: hypothetical protein WD708_03290 [Kiritimatiellia bacterium]
MKQSVKCGLWFFAGVLALPAGAQLSLPEDYVAPVRPEMRDREEQPVEEPMDEGMRRMMDQMTGRSLRREIQEPPDEEWNRLLERMKQRFRSGPDRIQARVIVGDGTRISGEVKNSSFFVRNAVGNFPLRLHEIERMQPVEGTGGYFTFELRGGDLLRGKPSLMVVSVLRADGGGRIVRISRVVSLILEMDAT